MDIKTFLTVETFIMFFFLAPFYIVFSFMIVANRHARNERRLTRELHMMATEEEARQYTRRRREEKEREEMRAQEQSLLQEAARRAAQVNHDSDDDEGGLHIYHKHTRVAPTPLPTPLSRAASTTECSANAITFTSASYHRIMLPSS
ncbi:unnamed protein product [Aureobasidium vineae]|uniref:Uncharacterized protein n=1 Tax=Aureobasidium vineae TaxID=2773715 RepID=A0A9N8JRW9_9PEZI|nr:unnamed protein product [Aureobasidium vineae]